MWKYIVLLQVKNIIIMLKVIITINKEYEKKYSAIIFGYQMISNILAYKMA
jgi:hypothetical protein